jgi:predicted MFS family arabinose efflux permease
MAMGQYHRALGQFVDAGILIAVLIAAKVFGVRVDQWSPTAKAASIALMVAVALIATLWIARRRRS